MSNQASGTEAASAPAFRAAPPRQAPASVVECVYEALAPAAFGALWSYARWRGTAAADLEARRGFVPPMRGAAVWIHGASAGEMAAGAALRRLLRGREPVLSAAFTTTNQAGLAVAHGSAEPGDTVSLVPWDRRDWLARAFDRLAPRLLLLVETELWPGLIAEAARRGVPVVLVSARIYPRDVARYRWIGPLVRAVLARVTLVLAQNEAERARFVALGADPARCTVAGSLKHLEPEGGTSTPAELASALGITAGEKLVVAGSIHEDEVALLFAALDRIAGLGVRACIAPRHFSAIRSIEVACAARGWSCVRRSRAAGASWRVAILDSVGELRAAYALARVAIVGGAFGAHGGHNPLEPLRARVPVLFGPRMDHFASEAAAVVAALPDTEVRGADEIAARLARWLEDDVARAAAIEAQRRALPRAEEVAERYLSALAPWIGKAAAPPPA